MIHLKRFNMKVKLHGYLSFPVDLSINEYSSSAFLPNYRLRSVIVHYGTPEKGHYVNFSLR